MMARRRTAALLAAAAALVLVASLCPAQAISLPPPPPPTPPCSDVDGDGVCDDVDNCPDVANADQATPTPEDPNGTACNVCDGNDLSGDTDGDGTCNDLDNDDDGDGEADEVDPCLGDNATGDDDDDNVCADLDNCPTVANPDQRDSDSDGLGDDCDPCPWDSEGTDTDGDTVCDASDNCPAAANTDQADEDVDGKGDACDDTWSPPDCAFATETGVHRIWPAPGVETLVYCDATVRPPSASVFYMEDLAEFELRKQEKVCVLEYRGRGYAGECFGDHDDNDAHILWHGGDTYQNIDYDHSETYGKWWGVWKADGTEDRNMQFLPGIRSLPAQFMVADEYSPQPIPFYASGKTVWLFTENLYDNSNALVWWEGATKAIDLAEVCTCCVDYDFDWSDYEDLYFVHDSVRTVTIGSLDDPECMLTLEFDWFANTMKARDEGHTYFNEDGAENAANSFDVEENPFGEQLPTVNGRVMRFLDENNMIIDGPVTNPWDYANSSNFLLRHGLDYWDDHGLDFLGHVDLEGWVWFTDYGHDDGGSFDCYDRFGYEDSMLGAAPTNIMALGFHNHGCPKGYTYDEPNLACVMCDRACPAGTYPMGSCGADGGDSCVPCATGCSRCDGPGPEHCTECGAGYFRGNGGELCGGHDAAMCIACDVGCASCTGPRPNECVGCLRGYMWDAGLELCRLAEECADTEL